MLERCCIQKNNGFQVCVMFGSSCEQIELFLTFLKTCAQNFQYMDKMLEDYYWKLYCTKEYTKIKIYIDDMVGIITLFA